MRNALIVFALFVLCVVPVWATEPGEPPDCSDAVFYESGLECEEVLDCDAIDDWKSSGHAGSKKISRAATVMMKLSGLRLMTQ